MTNYSLTALISIPEEAGDIISDRHFKYISDSQLYRVMIDKLEAIPQVSKIIVNTDSESIKKNYIHSSKVKVIDIYKVKPQEFELEFTSDRVTAALLKHVEGEHFLQLGSLFPFLRNETVQNVIETYDRYVVNPEGHSYDSVFTIKALNRRYYDSDTDFIREDRPNTFVEDGILHVFNRTTFLAGGNHKVGKKPFACIIDDIENFAIDSEENYRIAVFIDENRYRFTRVFGR